MPDLKHVKVPSVSESLGTICQAEHGVFPTPPVLDKRALMSRAAQLKKSTTLWYPEAVEDALMQSKNTINTIQVEK